MTAEASTSRAADARRTPVDEHRRGLPWLWPLLIILLFSTAVDALFSTGYSGMDSRQYTSGAYHILSEGRLPERVSLGQERMVPVGWNALIGWLIGWDPQLIAGSYIFFHQALTLCTFLFARRWFDWRAGLLAAWCVALYPEVVIHSTIMIPDIPLALFILLAVGAFVAGRELREAGRGGWGLTCYLLAGLSVGMAYMTKSTALLVLPFFLVLWLWSERGRPGVMAIGAGFAFVLGIVGVFVLEWALFRIFTGQTYFRLSWLFAAEVPGEQLISRYGSDPLGRLSRFLGRADGFRGPRDLGVLFIVSAVLYPLVVRRRWSVVLLPVWWFAYLTWGTMSFSRYFPGPIHLRYYIPALPFLAIVSGAVAVRLWEVIGPRVRPATARRGLLIVLIGLAVAVPLRHLRAPNRLAGKFYRASAITGALDALHFGTQAGYEPLVMSNPLYQQLSGLYLDRKPERFVPGADIPEDQIDQLLEEGFYYIACPQAMFSEGVERSRRAIVDDVLHPAIKEDPYPNSRTEGPWAVRVFSGSGGRRQVFVGGRRLVVREISRFGPLRDRLTEYMALIAPHPRGHALDEFRRQAGLYHVQTRPAELGTPLARELTPALWGWQTVDGRDQPLNWGVGRGSRCELTRTAGDGLRIRFDLEADEHRKHIWLMGRRGTMQSDLHLTEPGLYTLTVETELEGGVFVQVLLRAYDQPDANLAPVGEWRVKTTHDRTAIEFFHVGGDLYPRLLFKLGGRGVVTFKRVLLTWRPEAVTLDSASPEG